MGPTGAVRPWAGSRRRLLGGALGLGLGTWIRSLGAAGEPLYPHFTPLDVAGLYAKRLRFSGREPIVSIGLGRGLEAASLASERPVRLMFDEAGIPKRVFASDVVRLEPEAKSGGRFRYWVVVSRHAYRDVEAAEAETLRWTRRGLETRTFERGIVVALAGNVLDTRERRVAVGGFWDRERAEDLRHELFDEEGVAHAVEVEVVELPAGRVLIEDAAGQVLHRADGAVCVSPARTDAVRWTEGGAYSGHVYGLCDRWSKLTLVNSVGTERMLQGLVPEEIFARAPLEALKAQAVTARGAVFAKLGHRHFDEPFFLCSETHCQVYGGTTRERATTNEAVHRTRGLLAVRPRADAKEALELVRSVYSSTCGGFSEANEVVWDQRPSSSLRPQLDGPPTDPALAEFAGGLDDSNIEAWLKSFPPTYEAKSSFNNAKKYRWRVVYSKPEIDGLVASLGVGSVKRLEILGRGPGGRVTGVRVHGHKDTADVLRELPVRRRFGNLNSGMFILEHRRNDRGELDSVEFIGGGWGHGVGMCQIGAIGRAQAGQDFRTILAHYYAGAVVERLY